MQTILNTLMLNENASRRTWSPGILEKMEKLQAKSGILEKLRLFNYRLEISPLAIMIQLQESNGCGRFPINACCLPS